MSEDRCFAIALPLESTGVTGNIRDWAGGACTRERMRSLLYSPPAPSYPKMP